MSGRLIIFVAILLASVTSAFSQSTVASAQQVLKDQGFYYGEITGTKDADTTAAIRRYQIRNGLQVTGDLNAETLKSLGLKGGASSTPTPSRSTPPPSQAEPEYEDDASDLRDDSPDPQPPPSSQDPTTRPSTDPGYDEEPGYGADARAEIPAAVGVFAGTPYETAPPEVQRQIIAGAQAFLARRGYYRSGVDGLYGPGTEFALRAYQARFGLPSTGRLDMATLASFGLLPEQQGRGLRVPRRRIFPGRPPVLVPPGERIYIPR